jgi:hypothetical protein
VFKWKRLTIVLAVIYFSLTTAFMYDALAGGINPQPKRERDPDLFGKPLGKTVKSGWMLTSQEGMSKPFLPQGKAKAVIVTAQVLSGYAIAAGIGISLWQISRSRNDVGGEPLLELSIPPGIVLGSSTVVYWIGNSWGKLRGSYVWTAVGALTPVVAGSILGAALNRTSPDGFSPVLFGAGVGYIIGSSFSPIGAVVGYHLSR